MDVLANRVKRAVESVLENEGLVSGLDESAATVLQDWGIKNVKRIAEETGELDDVGAEEAMYPKMKASRRFIRAIRVWVQNERESSVEERNKLWTKVEKRAQELYGATLSLPAPSEFSGQTSTEFIRNLRDWLEGDSSDDKGGKENKSFLGSLFGR